ncbi:MAG TPA: Ku protein [Thermoanaerobaculia bacterium]
MPDWDDSEEQEAVARAFWSGTITFGLVSIPVALYAANRPRRVSLRMVGPKGTPLARRYFTTKDDRELDADDIVRGYEIEKGRFVIVDDDELERLAPERTRDIDVRRFVDADEIDPMYFERAYYLTPAGGSNKAYRLLAQVMEEAGRAGIATFVMRAREYLVAIIAENGILRAETLRFADELRSPADAGLPEPVEPKAAQVTKISREIGKRIEHSLAKTELADRSAERLLKLARAKLKSGKGVVHVEEREGEEDRGEQRPVIDLMEILKQRMAGVGADEDEAPASSGRKAPSGMASSGRKASSGKKASSGGKAKSGRKASSSGGDADLRESSRAELLQRARKLDIPGRSGMSKDQLVKAIRKSA